MTARILAEMLTADSELQDQIERDLVRHEFNPRELDAVRLLTEHSLEVSGRDGAPDSGTIRLALTKAIDTVFSRRNGPAPDPKGASRSAPSRRSSPPTQATRLVELAREAELFRSPLGDPFASVILNGYRETFGVRSAGFRGWLARRYHDDAGRVPNAQAVGDALSVLDGDARYRGFSAEVHVRVAFCEGVTYLDLADPERRIVEIKANGWSIVADPPVRFRRPRGMLPLPVPERGGNLEDFLRLLNPPQGGADSMILVVGWLLSILQPEGSYPVLVIHGEQGSAKSTAAGLLKRIADPSSAPLRSEPREVDDLMIAAANSRVLAFDNLSKLHPWLSDALCRLSSGGGLSKRELYTDAEETILEAKRPSILNGIEELATRPDLLDRCILLHLPAIPENKRRPEADVLRDLEALHPRILGALLDAAAGGLCEIGAVRLDRLPRMADFARWVVACCPSIGIAPEAFLAAYAANRAGANALALDSSPVAGAVLRLVESGPFEGTAQEILAALEARESPNTVRHRLWPETARGVTGALQRVASNLRAEGVTVTHLPRRGSGRRIRLERLRVDAGVGSVTTDTPPPPVIGDGCLASETSSPDRHPVSSCGPSPDDDCDGSDGPSPSPCIEGVTP